MQANTGASPRTAAGRRGPSGSRRSLKNWRVRSRLVALIAVPTLLAVILGGVRLVSSAQSALGYQRVVALANLGGKITGLAQALEDERDTTAGFIAQDHPPDQAGVVEQASASSSQWAEQVTKGAREIGRGYPAETRTQASAVITAIGGLAAVRAAALNGTVQPLAVVQDYSRTIGDLLALDDDIAQGSGDSALAGTVHSLGLVSRMKEEASQQRGLLSAALTRGQFAAGELDALEAAQAQQASNLAEFNTSATAGQRQLYLGAVSGPLVTQAGNEEQNAISRAGTAGSGSLRGITAAGGWYAAMSDVINRMRAVETSLTGAAISRSATLRKDAITSMAVGSAAVVFVLLISVLFTSRIARSMVGPLRQLRAEALDIAGVRLPEIVRRLAKGEDEDVPSGVDAVGLDSADEIGDVARAFGQVQSEALRLAANEGLLRSNINAMFVNLSRRTQLLVERQLEMIDDLEQGEAEPARLESLFRMDHLATRMRRNSENLLVLAGHEGNRRWKRPVSVLNVLRAAVSEVEQYGRVQIDAQPGPAVRGPAVADVVHLVAELVDNATAFSPAETPVTLSGRMQNGGRVLLEISDQGVGMGGDDIAQANARLDNPPVVDVEVSRRMGLFVVGRLAARHGIKVRLGPSPEGGLAAVIWMPDELIVQEPEASTSGQWAAVPPAGRTPGKGGGAGTAASTPGPWDAVGAAGGTSGPWAAVGPARGTPDPWAAVDPVGATGPMPSIRAPFDTPLPSHEKIGATSAPAGTERDLVVVPSGGDGGGNRLPIFESVGSGWFHGGSASGSNGHLPAGIDPVSGSGRTEARDEGHWTSPGDEGWRAAEAMRAPVANGTTDAGLPKRIPRANLVPGTAGRPETGGFGDDSHRAPLPDQAEAGAVRSAQEIRERLSSFQRGARAGHAAGEGGEHAAGEEEWEGNA